MTVAELITELSKHREAFDEEVVLNIWTTDDGGEPMTVEGNVEVIVPVSSGLAIKGDEIL